MIKITMGMLLLAGSLAAQNYAGIWNGQGGKEDAKYGTVPQTAQMTLLQAGSSVSGGSLKLGNFTPLTIVSGSVSGTKLSFVAQTKNGQQITANLTASGGQLTGKMYGSNGTVFDFVFTKH